ncbi:hypothetical protein ACTWJ9_33650 (plasmid) [Streptomyces sp. GDS52]|uniref:hypothetical protein n=1 Tax=Streptomyces sp. GDS52 TaxID=3406419 RepID=UPI003FD1D2E3
MPGTATATVHWNPPATSVWYDQTLINGRTYYLVVHHLADQFLSQHWGAVLAVADVLATRLHLTGGHIADLAGIPNGTHSATCTA